MADHLCIQHKAAKMIIDGEVSYLISICAVVTSTTALATKIPAGAKGVAFNLRAALAASVHFGWLGTVRTCFAHTRLVKASKFEDK